LLRASAIRGFSGVQKYGLSAAEQIFHRLDQPTDLLRSWKRNAARLFSAGRL
jgi:hypothetical protein